MHHLPYSPINANVPGSQSGKIYFIVGGPFVKIGHTTRSIFTRMKCLQTCNPYRLKLVLIVDGTIGHERELHRKFSDLRAVGEWFRHEEPLASYISGILAVTPHSRLV